MEHRARSIFRLSLLTAALVGGLLAAGCRNQERGPGQPAGAPGRPPMGGPGRRSGGPGGGPVAADASGAEIFAQKCQGCHGAKGTGGRAPSLASLSEPPAALHKTIHDGKGRMPAFGSQLTAAQIDRVVEYLKGLGKAAAG